MIIPKYMYVLTSLDQTPFATLRASGAWDDETHMTWLIVFLRISSQEIQETNDYLNIENIMTMDLHYPFQQEIQRIVL